MNELWSIILTVTFFNDLVPSSPIGLSASLVSGDPYSLFISWMKPQKPNGMILSYNVYCLESNISSSIQSLSSTSDIFDEVVSGNSFNATVGGLTPFKEYGCFVSANTSIGEGNNSFVAYQTTDEYSK